jgi:hypothetical protein
MEMECKFGYFHDFKQNQQVLSINKVLMDHHDKLKEYEKIERQKRAQESLKEVFST